MKLLMHLIFYLKDCDVVITSGGLGPTEDDITKEKISESLSLELELDDDHLEWMKERWKARGLIMPDTNINKLIFQLEVKNSPTLREPHLV
ncbi:MAG: hypothetical protein Ct9H90mP10_10770 [Actinomycetota bacterium]|nr:MAG: hypothetical protein Ct9H90mP10_10770 [Actinomycetota bacterium]